MSRAHRAGRRARGRLAKAATEFVARFRASPTWSTPPWRPPGPQRLGAHSEPAEQPLGAGGWLGPVRPAGRPPTRTDRCGVAVATTFRRDHFLVQVDTDLGVPSGSDDTAAAGENVSSRSIPAPQ
jgi:hypothetical protein